LKPNARQLTIRAMSKRKLFTFAALVALIFLCPFFAVAENFKFAFLSDTHVGSESGAEDLRATVRDINSLTGFSFVVISGDITEYGSRTQLLAAKEILSGIKIPWHLTPGNHDTKWSESGGTDFPKIFGNERFNIEFGGYRFLSIHEGPLMKMGDGHWSPQDIRWLDVTLKNLPDKKQPIVFITHYPVDDQIGNWHVVLDLLKKYNTQIILCGHGHANKAEDFEGVPGTMGRSNLRAGESVGGYNLVEVADGKMIFTERNPGVGTKPSWRTVELKKHNYAKDKTKWPRPSFAVNAEYPFVKERWQRSIGWTISSTPAVWRNLAIVGNASGFIRAFELATGKEKWKFKTEGPVYSTPDISGDRVVFASTDGNVYCLNAEDGNELWRFKTDRAIVACPRIVDGVVYIGSSENKFRALDLENGKLVWEFPDVAGFVETKPLVYQGKVIFGAWGQYLYALDAKTGKLAWKWEGPRGALLSPAACWPIGASGKIFIVAPDRKMTALDAATGNEIYRTGEYVVRETIGLSEDASKFYVRTMGELSGKSSATICAFSTSASKPEKVLELNLKCGYDHNAAMIVEKNGTIFYGSKSGVVYSADAKTGALKWEHKLCNGVINTLAPVSSHEVLATDFDGRITLLDAKPR